MTNHQTKLGRPPTGRTAQLGFCISPELKDSFWAYCHRHGTRPALVLEDAISNLLAENAAEVDNTAPSST